MMRYQALLDGENGAYGVTFPQLPGCVAMGATKEEALHNAAEALIAWITCHVENGWPYTHPADTHALMPVAGEQVVEVPVEVPVEGQPALA